MKQFLFSLPLLMLSLISIAQEVPEPDIHQKIIENSKQLKQLGNNEIRINAAYAIAGFPEVNYERFLADNMGLGIAAAVSFENVDNMKTRSQILPYARLYFGEKKASGFFIEANVGLFGQKSLASTEYIPRYDSLTYSYDTIYTPSKKLFSAGFGIASGVKFLTRNGFNGEIYLGLGRFFGDKSINGAYPRLGICIGKRF